MCRNKLYSFIIIFLTLAFSVYSQDNRSGYPQKLKDILALDDVNEQKYRLTIFNEGFNEWLMQNDPAEADGVLKHTETGDKVFSIFYYTYQRSVNEVRYVLFVKYKDDRGEVQVHNFEQTVVPDVKSPENLKDPVIRPSSRVIDGVKFYEVSFSAENDPLVWFKYSDLKLKCLFEEILKSKDDDRKKEINKSVLSRSRLLWNSQVDFENDFAGQLRMKTIFSEDGKVKLCTYGILFNDFTNRFYGAVIRRTGKDVEVFELSDKTDAIRSPSRVSLSNTKWYGAIYLDIIQRQYQKKTYYTLLGYKGQDEFVKTRVVDVLWFPGNKPRFGAPVFKNDRYTYNRLIFKYSVGANMVLRYDAKKKMIVMDNLEPSDAMYKGVYRFYGPDFTYNGYKFEKGKWVLYKNIDLRNE